MSKVHIEAYKEWSGEVLIKKGQGKLRAFPGTIERDNGTFERLKSLRIIVILRQVSRKNSHDVRNITYIYGTFEELATYCMVIYHQQYLLNL